MTSEVDIFNLALSNLRAGSINSINEPSLQAQQCKLAYPFMRRKCLRENNWNFARKIIALTPVTDEIFTQPYAYKYPNDCLKIETLLPAYTELSQSSGGRYYYPTEGYAQRWPEVVYTIYNVNDKKIIGAALPELRIDYTSDVEDPNLFSVEFIMALSHLLASQIAIAIVGVKDGRALRSDSLSLYSSYLNSGIASDSNEKHHEPVESEFVTCRG